MAAAIAIMQAWTMALRRYGGMENTDMAVLSFDFPVDSSQGIIDDKTSSIVLRHRPLVSSLSLIFQANTNLP
jgi:hypothetical protein